MAGLDLGKARSKVVVLQFEGEHPRIEHADTVVHEGKALERLAEWYDRFDLAGCDAVGATGLHADELAAPILHGLPETACLEEAMRWLVGTSGPVNVVSIGARGYAAASRDASGMVHHAESDKCSAGTGETIVKTAGRFGQTAEDADRMATEATEAIPITARCSVFAKSEMTHFGNQGKPADALFRGYFDSIARYVGALLERVRVPGPVYFIGGCSRFETLRRGLSEHLGVPVDVPEDAPFFEAFGAACIADEQARTAGTAAMPPTVDTLLRPKATRFEVLSPAREHAHRVTVLEPEPIPEGAAGEPCVLGLDLGSTGSKAVLTSIATGQAVMHAYDRTRGNPVDAAQRLVRSVLERVKPDVRAIGVTGSGREAAARVLRAAHPDDADRIVVVNEIVAHATAAIRCDPDGGESLSIVEIGGQDAKFCQVVNGQIVESDMNKACSAGTGSFLEEQAVFYGVHDIREFTRLACTDQAPPNLGQMCTVFVAEAAAEAHGEGFDIPALFAGFQYSVIHNYLNRVMGQRTFGKRVFFQGKPASGPALAWTLAAVSGREVVVPPNPGEMGAWGVGLCAIDALGERQMDERGGLDVAAFLDAEVTQRAEIRCRDSSCNTLCHIDRTTVAIGRKKHVVLSGGACPKFEVATATKPKLPRDAPSAFDERRALLAPYLEPTGEGRPIGVPLVGALAGLVPWAVTLLRGLGLDPQVLQSDARSLPAGEELCRSYDACAPSKVAHGVADAGQSLLFWPKVLGLPDREGPGGATCPMEQAMPDLARTALEPKGRAPAVEAPVLDLRHGLDAVPVTLTLARMAARLGFDVDAVPGAIRSAARAQQRYERELAAIGDRTMRYGREHGLPTVVVCGSLHVVHEPAINAGIPGILRENGVLPLPMDCFEVPDHVDGLPRAVWGDANRALRVGIAARESGHVFPLLLSSFGCGPASFIEQIFDMLMGGYPHTALETDGHGGTAGYVTRIQAFLHGVRQYDGTPSPVPESKMRLVDSRPDRPLEAEMGARLVTLPIGDRLGAIAAASYRSLGHDAVSAGPNDSASLHTGRKDCSGKECVPYQFIWGSFRKHVEQAPEDERTVLVQVQGQGACRNCMFSVKDRMSLDHLGLSDRVSVRHIGGEGGDHAFFSRFWAGTVAWDILCQMAAYHRPLTDDPEEVERLHLALCDRLESAIERRQPTGLRGMIAARECLQEVGSLLEYAAERYEAVGRDRPNDRSLRTVLVTGDIYLRIDPFSSEDIVRKLNARGLQVIVDPATTLVEYLTEEESAELLGLPTDVLQAGVTRVLSRRIKDVLYGKVRQRHPWLPVPDVPEALRHADPIMGRTPLGEAPITVGTVLQAWEERQCDGVVVVGPWGCGPALISESVLRHQRHIPIHFFYGDGSPMDERRLNGFAYRLQRSEPRTVAGKTSEVSGGAPRPRTMPLQ